jgi:hypothetical protein
MSGSAKKTDRSVCEKFSGLWQPFVRLMYETKSIWFSTSLTKIMTTQSHLKVRSSVLRLFPNFLLVSDCAFVVFAEMFDYMGAILGGFTALTTKHRKVPRSKLRKNIDQLACKLTNMCFADADTDKNNVIDATEFFNWFTRFSPLPRVIMYA